MELIAHVKMIGTDSSDYMDKTGAARTACYANVSQKNGQIIDTVRIPPEFLSMLKQGEDYNFSMISSNGRNGLYLRLVDIQPATE